MEQVFKIGDCVRMTNSSSDDSIDIGIVTIESKTLFDQNITSIYSLTDYKTGQYLSKNFTLCDTFCSNFFDCFIRRRSVMRHMSFSEKIIRDQPSFAVHDMIKSNSLWNKINGIPFTGSIKKDIFNSKTDVCVVETCRNVNNILNNIYIEHM